MRATSNILFKELNEEDAISKGLIGDVCLKSKKWPHIV